MKVRAHIAMVVDLGSCLGCHACTLACRRERPPRRGAEHAWHAHVETRPGPGWPRGWDDFERRDGKAPTLDDFGEPWLCDAAPLLESPPHDDRPTARRVSALTGSRFEPPLDGSHYDGFAGAEHDANVRALLPELRRLALDPDRRAFFHLPRLCNQCLLPACASAASACRYLKAIPNWADGSIESCDLCLDRLEAGRVPACVEVCGARFLGTLLYDADRLEDAARLPESRLVEGLRDLVLDPNGPEVLQAARSCGLSSELLDSAARSPIVPLVKRWGIALPLHPELRTLPMVFYVPPLLPARSSRGQATLAGRFGAENERLPLAYLARLFAGGAEEQIRIALFKLAAGRAVWRAKTVGDVDEEELAALLADAQLSTEQAASLAELLSSDEADRRVVLPPLGGAR